MSDLEDHGSVESMTLHDEEAALPSRCESRTINRSSSSATRASVRTWGAVDPAVALPTTYRTLSHEISGSQAAESRQDALPSKKPEPRDIDQLEWHMVSPFEVSRQQNVSITRGLSGNQSEKRLQFYGRNVPSPPKSNKLKDIFFYFFGGFGGILLAGAVLVFVSWKPLGRPPAMANLALAIVLVIVFLLQAGFNMFQDWSTSKVMSSIKNLLPDQCEVTREGVLQSISTTDLVPGDLVSIKSGRKLPADVRFITVSSDAKFDRSVLTGESLPVAATVHHTDTNYLETHNIGLQGTHCVVGTCTGIVVATGDDTVFGRIAALTNEPKTKATPLEREIWRFVRFISILMTVMILAVSIIWIAWLRREHPGFIDMPTMIVDCVSVAIAFIPEGLPIAITAGLTITAKMMKKNKILCKSLKTVETLGSVSVICSDKTGTLTQGKMAVIGCCIGNEIMTVDEAKARLSLAKEPQTSGAVKQLAALCALCNSAQFDIADQDDTPLAERTIFGDATDSAILRFAEEMEDGIVAYVNVCWRKIYELAFNSKNKFMIRCFVNSRVEAVSHAMPTEAAKAFQPQDLFLTIKGAPDILLDQCSRYVTSSGAVAPLDKEATAALVQIKDAYSSQGRRCLIVAQKTVSRQSLTAPIGTAQFEEEMLAHSKSGLTLVGLVAIVDPLRPEIESVVTTLRGAGIKIAMVTGDFALTALAIARDAGIVTSPIVDNIFDLNGAAEPPSPSDESIVSKDTLKSPKSIVISGSELNGMKKVQWGKLLEYDEIVFARTSPEQKLNIVRAFQEKDVVAMTGDGVNDAPSLKAADVGICMGSGCDIAMEAADMVLLEDFSSMVTAVKYGRVVFDNLKKVIAYLLPAGSFSEFWPVMAVVALGLPQVLSSFLMIIICCLTDCVAAIFLSYEAAEADVLLRKPRHVKKDRLVNWKLILHAYGIIGMIETTASFALAFWYLDRKGIAPGELVLCFGKLPEGMDQATYNARLNEASSIYFVSLVVMQCFNLLAVRTRRLSIFQHPPLFNKRTQNVWLFPSIGFALVMAIMWLYVPQLQPIAGTAAIPAEYWFLPFAVGIWIIFLDEARRFLSRKYPRGIIAKMAW